MNPQSGPEVNVRRATAADHDVIVEFNRRLAEESEGKRLDPETLQDGVRRALEDESRGIYFVAESAGEVAGQTLITFEWSDWRNGWFWWIQSVYVARPYRQRGIFRGLFSHIEHAARRRGDVCGLRLYVEHGNRAGIDTYERLGMTPTGHLLYEIDWSGAAERRT